MSAVQILRVMRHDNNDNISATTLLCIECHQRNVLLQNETMKFLVLKINSFHTRFTDSRLQVTNKML